jgi:hypothetical protein
LWTGSWLVFLVCLLSAWPSDAVLRVWIEKIVIAIFGIIVGVVATRSQIKWQPWVCTIAALFLALHALLASLLWLATPENSDSFLQNLVSNLAVRPLVFAAHLMQGSYGPGARYAYEQLLMPIVQLAAIAFSLLAWQTPPSNSAPHRDGRQASHGGQPSSAPARGRER